MCVLFGSEKTQFCQLGFKLNVLVVCVCVMFSGLCVGGLYFRKLSLFLGKS